MAKKKRAMPTLDERCRAMRTRGPGWAVLWYPAPAGIPSVLGDRWECVRIPKEARS